MDDCMFDNCVIETDFEKDSKGGSSIVFCPPQGEFTLMNYRVSQLSKTSNTIPFTFQHNFQKIGNKIEFAIKIKCHILPTDKYAHQVLLSFSLPSHISKFVTFGLFFFVVIL